MTNLTGQPETVEGVTQADIEAAEAAWNWYADEFNDWAAMSETEHQHWVNAFARHRLASHPTPAGAAMPDDAERERWESCNCPTAPFDDEVIYDRNLSPRCPRCNVALGGDPMTDRDRVALAADQGVNRAHTPDAMPDDAVERMRVALHNLERRTTELYRGIAPGGNYGANTLASDRNESTFADRDEAVLAARAALATNAPEATDAAKREGEA